MDAPCKWDARFLLTSMEGVVFFCIGPPIVHRVDAVLDASSVGSEVWQGQLPLVVEHALSPPTVTLPMSPVQAPVAVAHLGHPLVPLVYPHEGDWCAPTPYEIYVVAAVDVPNIPTGHHQALSPEPPLGHVPQTLAACFLVHVASLHVPLEALHQHLLSPAHQHHYWEEVRPRLDHAPCRCPRQGD
jgi:hypothetical protein